jgi:hypothetical protein
LAIAWSTREPHRWEEFEGLCQLQKEPGNSGQLMQLPSFSRLAAIPSHLLSASIKPSINTVAGH